MDNENNAFLLSVSVQLFGRFLSDNSLKQLCNMHSLQVEIRE
jgi:hypothetical protein